MQSTVNVGKNEKLFGVIGLFIKHVSPILSAILTLQAILSLRI